MSEEKGKISVIVPVYQAEKYLAKALDSVISQDYENWELFLLVRKSSDQSEKIARDYEKKYDSIHMIERGENKVGEARNQGLEKAQGEYVLFLDSDDYLPDASVMQRYVRMAEQTDADIVVANYARLWNGKMLPAVSHASFSRYHRNSQEFQFRGFFSAGTLSYVWGKLYRRSFLEKNQIRFAKYDYAEDKFFNMHYPKDYERIIAITYKFSFGWRRIHNPDTNEYVADNLTTTEFTIAMLASRGWTNQEIADYMQITPRTVKQHMTCIFNKMSISNRKQLKDYMLR